MAIPFHTLKSGLGVTDKLKPDQIIKFASDDNRPNANVTFTRAWYKRVTANHDGCHSTAPVDIDK